MKLMKSTLSLVFVCPASQLPGVPAFYRPNLSAASLPKKVSGAWVAAAW